MNDFFISYNQTDQAWAEWIAWQLEESGYSVIIQAWDFRPGGNFALDMQRAATESERTIAVLSPDYLTSQFSAPEWAAAFAQDPTGEKGLLLPVRVRACELQGLLPQIVYIDLVGADESKAKDLLLAGINRKRAKPVMSPIFPHARAITDLPSFPGALPTYWHVPHNRNPHFTGRDGPMRILVETLKHDRANSVTLAITGLGGVGKTQLAVEYAFRHASDYAGVWWFLSETSADLCRDFSVLSDRLDLATTDEKDSQLLVEAVRERLGRERQPWLLVYDNAFGPQQLTSYLPQAGCHHILITSRNRNWRGVAKPLDLMPLSRAESVEFLLKRSESNRYVSTEALASALADALGDLPLALEQAGAYIEETGCGLADYLAIYKTKGAELRRRRGGMATEHPDPVATTWNLSFESIEKANPPAAELLRFCAFLHPDAIPEELITEGASELGPILAPVAADSFMLNTAIADTLKYSLLRRNSDTKTLEIHRLVQAVLKDGMDEETQRHWADRATRAWDHAFPSCEFAPWPLFQGTRSPVPDSKELIDAWSKDCPEGAKVHHQNTALLMQTRANLRKLAQLYGTIRNANEAIVRASNREGLFINICRGSVAHDPFVMAWIGLVDETAQTITPIFQYPEESGYLKNPINVDEISKERDPTGTAIHQDRVAYVNDNGRDECVLPWITEALSSRVRAGAAMPLRSGGKVIGALTLYVHQPDFFDSDQIDFLEALSVDMSSALDGYQQSVRCSGTQTALQKMLKKLEGRIQETAFPPRGRDRQTLEHQRNVSQLAVAIARKMRIDEKQIDIIRFGGLIHDIGNILVPVEILCKPGQLTPIELKIVHSHVQEGYNIVKDIDGLRPVAEMILQHHERLDGFGYPTGLADADIVPAAKILAVADRVIGSLSSRPGRPPLDIEETLKKIKKDRGVLYNSDAVDACLSLFNENKFPKINERYSVQLTRDDRKN